MVSELQFIAVAAFLIWGLVASLCGVLAAAPDTARLVWRHRGSKPEPPTPANDRTGDRTGRDQPDTVVDAVNN
jgi:hypothetical protein